MLRQPVLLRPVYSLTVRSDGAMRLAGQYLLQDAPPLSQFFFLLRCEAESIPIPDYLAAREQELGQMLGQKNLVRKKYRPQAEAAFAALRQRATEKLAATAKDNLRHVIRGAHDGSIGPEQIWSPLGMLIFEAFQTGGDRESLRRLLLHVERLTGLLDKPEFARAVIALARNSDGWLRQPELWKPRTKNARRQFNSLARHLWATFDVPLFMDTAWFSEQDVHQQWFRLLGQGGNIRQADGLPCPLTKQMAHHFLLAPDDYSIQAALRWGQILALGGDKRLADAVVGTRLEARFCDDPFWLSVFRFFVANPMLDRAHVGPIVDYIWNQRFEPRVEQVARGVPVQHPPVQPNFSMRGRTVQARGCRVPGRRAASNAVGVRPLRQLLSAGRWSSPAVPGPSGGSGVATAPPGQRHLTRWASG